MQSRISTLNPAALSAPATYIKPRGGWFSLRSRHILGCPPHRPVPDETRRRELVSIALARYGVLAREWHRNEDPAVPWSELFPELERGEWRGELRRGHFLEGLAGMQFALPAAVEQLRASPDSGFLLLNACDPANPYGGELFPNPEWRVYRRPANQVLLHNGACVLYAENHGARWRVREGDEAAITAYLERRTGDPLAVTEINGQPAGESPFAGMLLRRGFTRQAEGVLRQGFGARVG